MIFQIFNRNLTTKQDSSDDEVSRGKNNDDLVLRNMSSQINDSTYTTKLQRTYTLPDNIEVHSVILEPNQKTSSSLEPHNCQQLQFSTTSQNVTQTSNSGGNDFTFTCASSSSSAQRLQKKCKLSWKPAGDNNQGAERGITKTDVQQPRKIRDDSCTFNLSSKSNVVVESCKMVQVEPNKWIQVKRYKRAPAQPTNQNKNPQCRNFGRKSPERNNNVPCFQNRIQTYKSTDKDAIEQNKNVILTAPPQNLKNQKQDSTSIEKEFYQKSDVIIVSLDRMKSQFKDFETGKVQSQKASNRKEATNAKVQKQENNSSWQNFPQSNKMQQNKSGSEVPKHTPNINSLIQHEHLNTNVHTGRVETSAYVESSETHSPAETTKFYSNQHANQLSPVEDHCLPNEKTNQFGSTRPIMGLESRGEIIYSREGTDGGETAGFFH